MNQHLTGMSDTPQQNRQVSDRRRGRTLDELEAEILNNVAQQMLTLKTYVDSAFPRRQGETDAEAIANHKRYHDGLIKSSEKWDKIWTDIFTTIAKGGLWFLAALVATALWQAFVAEVKK